MRKIKRSCGDVTRRLRKNKRTSNDDVQWDSNQGVWSELSQEVASSLSRSVVSVALSDGNTVLFACSGMALECQGCVTRFLTSVNLVRALKDRSKDHDNLKVEVHHEGYVFIGFLWKYDLDHSFAIVNVMTPIDVQVILPDLVADVELLPYSKVVAVGRGISGKLMATGGILTYDSSGSEDSEDLMLSTCKISEAWEGGPLFDIEGSFVGMNLFFVKERTVFLPKSIILECLERFRMSLRKSKFLERLEKLKADRSSKDRETDDLARSSKKNKRTGEFIIISKKNKRTDNLTRSSKKIKGTYNGGGKTTEPLISGYKEVLFDDRFGNLNSLGYPKLPKDILDRMVLVNTFEEPFGDIYGGGVWSELSETVSSRISQNVVSLASFFGTKRIFVCTGFFIQWNGCTTILTSASLVSDFVDDHRIFGNLRIEVLLPNKQPREGTLQHYNLHYNVALVSVKDFCAPYPANIEHQMHDCSGQLAAVGRSFKSGMLMAARGKHMNRHSELNCKFLQYSTCKITKAGIGGPLIDFDGNFIGMNFYDAAKRTRPPFLLWDAILDVLAYFKTKWTVAEVGYDGYQSDVLDWTIVGDKSVHLNSWPVDQAFWCPPEFADNLGKADGPMRGKRPCPPRLKIINGKKYWFA